jgi:penicillin-binding protein-related factor A (putative recombinase)
VETGVVEGLVYKYKNIIYIRERIMAKSEGKQFETDVENSCKSQKIFYHRIKDVSIPPDLRTRIKVGQNKYDSLIFYNGILFPIEFKSTGQKSISFDPKIIKPHQITNLQEAMQFEDVVSGFIFNFREYDNYTCFIHINDFIAYKNVAEGLVKEHTYKNKINKSSISLDVCKEISTEILNGKKKVHYFYDMKKLLDKLIKK